MHLKLLWRTRADQSLLQTSSEVKALDVNYPSPGNFHKIKTEIRDVDGKNISVKFYLDGKLITTQYGRDYIGKPLHL
jgi:ribosomal protein S3AE